MWWAALFAGVWALQNGLGSTPPMGYSSWNDCSSDVTEQRIINITNALIQTGLAAKGYRHVNVDEGWLLGRNATTGEIISDPSKFPHGMTWLGSWLHSQIIPGTNLSMLYGLYTCRGSCQCSTSEYQGPGSLGYEKVDAEYFAAAGADYLKEDSCCGSQDHAVAFQEYATMRDALNATGRPIYFSLCGWESWYAPVGAYLGNQWRIAGDGQNWEALVNCINVNAPLSPFAGPGHWNDPDLLQNTGVGSYGPDRQNWYQSDLQSRSQFSMWCIMAAPLLISADISAVSQYALETWGNEEAIAVNQDPLGIQGIRVAGFDLGSTSGTNVWARPLANGSWAAVFLNNDPFNQSITCNYTCFSQMKFRAPNEPADSPDYFPVLMQNCEPGNIAQQWVVEDNSTIISLAYSRCLDVWNCDTSEQAIVDSYPCAAAGQTVSRYSTTCGAMAQTWTINANRTITSALTGQCLDQYEFSYNEVDIWDCNGGQNQQWNVLLDGTIRNQLSGQCLTATYYTNQTLSVRDLWLHQDIGYTTTMGFTAENVEGNGGCAMFVFTPV
eukprot:m.233308 g.233308  ORF g.233308 m.233308 type:complete len:553 (+) comp54289_c0_seq2:1-1659(+)